MSERATVPWSKLLQQPNQVTSLLEEQLAVQLARRGEEDDLVLMKQVRLDAIFAGSDVAARMFVALSHQEHGAQAISQAVPEVFPWVRFFPEKDTQEFTTALIETLRACAALDVYEPLLQTIIEWKHTAEVYADPEVYEALTRPITGPDGGPVPVPEVPA